MYFNNYLIIKMSNPHHCDYYYEGHTKSGYPVFHYNKKRAKLYSSKEEADRDMRMLKTCHSAADDVWSLETVRRKAQNI